MSWIETRNGTEVEALKLTAYQEDGIWRIDFHFDELGEREVYEPYQFKDQVGYLPTAVVRCHCCPNAPIVKPDVVTLRTALSRIWEDIEMRAEARSGMGFS